MSSEQQRKRIEYVKEYKVQLRRRTMQVNLLLPRQIDCAARFLADNASTATSCHRNRAGGDVANGLPDTTVSTTVKNDNENTVTTTTACCYHFVTLRVTPSRVLWNALRPLLFEAPKSISRRALFCILLNTETNCFQHEKNNETSSSWCSYSNNKTDNQQQLIVVQTTRLAVAGSFSRSSIAKFSIEERTFSRIPQLAHGSFFQSTTSTGSSRKTCDDSPVVVTVVVWIQPPHTVPLEYLGSGLLICWEHRLIQAQSLAGYVATLGGGFFLCHHFATAMLLAAQQQRLAVLLNDATMYYACEVHKAYSCIYSGRFRLARQLLRQVLRIVTGRKHQSNEVIERMCRSALLFGKRMRRQSQLLTTTSSSRRIDTDTVGSIQGLEHEQGGSSKGAVNQSSNPSKQVQPPTFDDFVRVRVIRDKSKKDDLVIPFSKACGG